MPKIRKAKFWRAKFYRRDLKIYATKTYWLARGVVRRQSFASLNFALWNLARKLSGAGKTTDFASQNSSLKI